MSQQQPLTSNSHEGTSTRSTPTISASAATSVKSSRSTCNECGTQFESRSLLFKHLKDTNFDCKKYGAHNPPPKAIGNKKVLLLYGYLPSQSPSKTSSIKNGHDASQVLMKAVLKFQKQIDSGFENAMTNAPINGDESNNHNDEGSNVATNNKEHQKLQQITKYNRSYGSASTGDSYNQEVCKQDDGTGAITEVLSTKMLPQLPDHLTEAQWINHVQSILDDEDESRKTNATKDKVHAPTSTRDTNVSRTIRILGRIDNVPSEFNAEIDVTHRRVEYI